MKKNLKNNNSKMNNRLIKFKKIKFLNNIKRTKIKI